MPVYTKVCIIDQRSFQTARLSSLYCSRKCRNRARYLPPKLLADLVRRNSAYTINANKYMAMTMEEKTALGYEPEGATVDNPLGKDYGLLLGQARLIAEQRGVDVGVDKQESIQPQQTTISSYNTTEIDPEMKDFKLPDEVPQQIQDTEIKKTGIRKMGGYK